MSPVQPDRTVNLEGLGLVWRGRAPAFVGTQSIQESLPDFRRPRVVVVRQVESAALRGQCFRATTRLRKRGFVLAEYYFDITS
jgi:hypothetical protein